MPPTGKAVLRLSLLALLLILGATIAQHQAESAHAAPNVVACNPGDPGYPNCSMMPSSGGSGGCCGSSMPSGNSGCCGSSMPSGNSGCCGSPYGSNVLPPTVCLAAVLCGAPASGQGCPYGEIFVGGICGSGSTAPLTSTGGSPCGGYTVSLISASPCGSSLGSSATPCTPPLVSLSSLGIPGQGCVSSQSSNTGTGCLNAVSTGCSQGSSAGVNTVPAMNPIGTVGSGNSSNSGAGGASAGSQANASNPPSPCAFNNTPDASGNCPPSQNCPTDGKVHYPPNDPCPNPPPPTANSTGGSNTPAPSCPAPAIDSVQQGYMSNLLAGDGYCNITNAGTGPGSGGASAGTAGGTSGSSSASTGAPGCNGNGGGQSTPASPGNSLLREIADTAFDGTPLPPTGPTLCTAASSGASSAGTGATNTGSGGSGPASSVSSCNGYLIGYVLNPTDDQPTKFDGLIGNAALRPTDSSTAPSCTAGTGPTGPNAGNSNAGTSTAAGCNGSGGSQNTPAPPGSSLLRQLADTAFDGTQPTPVGPAQCTATSLGSANGSAGTAPGGGCGGGQSTPASPGTSLLRQIADTAVDGTPNCASRPQTAMETCTNTFGALAAAGMIQSAASTDNPGFGTAVTSALSGAGSTYSSALCQGIANSAPPGVDSNKYTACVMGFFLAANKVSTSDSPDYNDLVEAGQQVCSALGSGGASSGP